MIYFSPYIELQRVFFWHCRVLFKCQKPDDEDTEILNHEEDFSLPQSFFVKEES